MKADAYLLQEINDMIDRPVFVRINEGKAN
jgi:hypothetical protein